MSDNLTDLQKKKKTRFPISRIKKLIQLNEDVGKTTLTVPVVLSKAIELFLNDLLTALLELANSKGTNKISHAHFLEVVSNQNLNFGFLKPQDKTDE